MNLALFDFDGTITNRDSFIDFIKFAKGNLKFFQGFMILSPILILYTKQRRLSLLTFLKILNLKNLKKLQIDTQKIN